MKPLININELTLTSHKDGPFEGKYADISTQIGAKLLGYSLTICPPGKTICPFHNHRVEEEMFFILEGEGKLRFGDKEYPLKQHDIIACPPGGRELAHQIINTGTRELKYLSLSTLSKTEVCEYPDSNKVGIFSETKEPHGLRILFKAEQHVDYFEGEY